MKKPMLIALGSFLATAVVIKAAPAAAEPPQPQNVSVVHTSDLDLASESGRRALDHRLVVAASDVCGSPSEADLAGQNAARQCRKDVLAQARARGEALAATGSNNGTVRVASNH